MDVAAGRPVISDAERHAMLTELRAWRERQRHELAPFETLTAREAQVLAALMDGQGCDAIASAWFVERSDGPHPDPRRAHQARRELSTGRRRPGPTGRLAPSPV